MKQIKNDRGKKRFIVGILSAFVLLVIGGTIAYNQSQTLFENKFELSSDVVDHSETFDSPEDWQPCQEIPKTVVTTNQSNHPVKVRLKYDEYWRNKADTENLPLEQDNTRLAIINFQNENDWELDGNWYYWKGQLAPGESTRSLFKSVTLNCEANFASDPLCIDGNCTDTPNPYEEAKYHVFITIQTTAEDFPSDEDIRTVTVDPNGGIYKNSNQVKGYEVLSGENYTLDEASRESYAFDHWEYVGGDHDGEVLASNIIQNITENITVRAIWTPAVARIERTGKLYTSIMRAEAEAQVNDVITLLVDTTETVTNEKTVTLDLNTHTVTGSLTNTATGNITLINGEINNPSGIAVTNNGALTMGINDYKQDGTVNILNENIRLIGTTTGIKQNGIFNFYDGFLEGDVGLEGGYNDAPVYRNTYDDVVVHYFPLVDHIGDTSRQHVELASADLAVTKTTVNGDIYYYNIQDNVNTSTRTGYKIYAVRDFNASYSVTIPADTTIDFDIVGYNITINDTLTNNGTLNIEDSHTTVTRGDATIVYGGLISVPQTIINNGNFNMNNIKIVGNSENDTIQNYANLKMRGSVLGATIGYVLHTISGATYDLDSNSYLYSTATGNYRGAVYNSISDFVWDTDGTIYGDYYGLENRGGVATIKKGTISGGRAVLGGNNSQTIVEAGGKITSSYCGFEENGSASIILDGGTLEISRTTAGTMIGVYGGALTIKNGGKMILTNPSTSSYEVWGTREAWLGMDHGEIEINVGSSAYRVIGVNHTGTNISNSTITVNAPNSTGPQGFTGYSWTTMSLADSIISVTGARDCKGVTGATNSNAITDTDITVTCDAGEAVAYLDSQYYQTTNFTNSNITAISTSGTAHGIKSSIERIAVHSGRVYGSTYGVYITSNQESTYSIIGDNDSEEPSITSPEIIGGSYALYGGMHYFYDGVLRGATSFQPDCIKAIPEGYERHTESSDDYAENTWLVPIANYLEVDGTGFNSLGAAYDAITGNSGTIKVIKDASIEASLPSSPSDKEITFDLNGHELTYTQPLVTNGIYTIQDSSNDKTGKLINTNTNSQVITNNGDLTIESGYISGARYGIYSNSGSSVVMNSGTIHGDNSGIYYYSASAITINGGLVEGGSYGINANGNGNTTVKTGGKITSNYCGFYSNGSAYLILDGGIIEISRTTSGDVIGIQNSGVSITNGGKILLTNTATASYKVYGVYNAWLSMDHAEMSIDTNSTWEVEGGWYNGATIADSAITVNAPNTSSSALMYSRYDGNFIATNSTLSLVGKQSCSGINGETRTNTITDSTITVSCVSGETYGYLINSASEATFTGSTISVTTETGTAFGIRIYQGKANVISGTIHGSTYGIWIYENNNQNAYSVIGINEGGDSIPSTTVPEIIGGSYALYGGSHYFYDGVLRGNDGSYQPGIIKAIPEGYTYHTEGSASYDYNTWLEASEKYLEVDGVEYNTLSGAYGAITGNSGTINVIKSATVYGALPGSPSDKEITFDLNGYELTYSQPLITNGTYTIRDSSNDKTGKLINGNNESQVITNNGNLTIESGYISGTRYGINATSGSTTTINSGIIHGNNAGIYYYAASAITINGGLVEGGSYGIDASNSGVVTVKTGAKIKSDYCGFRANGDTYVVLDGGIIEVSRTTSGDVIGVQSGGASVINGGKILLTNTANTWYQAYGVNEGWLSMDHGEMVINSNGTNNVYGVRGSANLTDSTITVTAPNSNNSLGGITGYGRTTLSVTRSIISVTGNRYCHGVDGQAYGNTVTDSTITVSCTSDESVGIHANGSNMTITGTNISAVNTNGTGYGIRQYQGSINVQGGSVYGNTYGIWLYDDGNPDTYTIIGENEGGTPSTTSPEIVGGSYALYGGKHNFYDGVLKGKVAAYNDEVVKQIADNSTFYIGTETIDDEEYEVRYLVPEYDVAQIGNTKYKKLSAAIAAAEENDEIELIADNYIFETINIPAEKKFTIDTKGYNIITGLPIKNYGNVILKNTSAGPTINYRSSGYFITNYADASLTLNNISINCAAGIDNKGSLSLTDSSIVTTSTAVSNSGTLTSNNTDLTGSDYAVYHSGTIANVDGGTLTGRYYNNSGTSTIANATLYKSGSTILDNITNNATLNISNSTATLVNNDCNYNYNTSYHARTILNSGTLNISNNSIINHELHYSIGDYVSVIYNNGSNATASITDSSLNIDSTDTSRSNTNYGIYNNDGTVTIESGSILVNAKESAYGIYNATKPSTITLGVAEPIDSQDRGKETAHVSTTNPNIKAIGRSRDGGIGIKNANGSKTNFYDGIVTGSTTAMPEEPAEVEYHYEAIEHTDGDGYNYRILEFMRNQN